MVSKRSLSRRRARKLAAGTSVAAVATLGLGGLGPVEEAGAHNEARPKLADPDQYLASDNNYYTYATTVRGIDGCGNPLWNTFYVPVIRTPTNNLDNQCIDGDAMPGGAGSWAASNSDIWAPSISYFSGKYFLHYSAMKPGGQWCIGRATSNSPMGPFTNQQEFACPPGGRWAIDPDVFVGGDGVFLTYRDDYITSGNQTGISSVQLNSNGHANWSTRRDLLHSTDVGWDYASRTNTHVVENPSLIKVDGRYKLIFSGNDWQSNKYAVGMADCGTTALPATRCKPLVDSNRPYFAYSASGHNPVRYLPGNHPGPGGMASTTTYKGTGTNVVWHWYQGGPNHDRRIKSGVMTLDGNGYFNVS